MLWTFAAALVGLVVGSFLGTLVLRPPKGLSVVRGRSVCPRCGHGLTAGELIPLVSWIVQRRKCRACGQAISIFYPAMEAGGAVVAALGVAFVPWPYDLAACLAGWALLVAAGRRIVKAGRRGKGLAEL